MIEKYLSVPEFAKKIGITRIAVFKKIKKGILPAIRIGRNWCISESYLEKYKELTSKKDKQKVVKQLKPEIKKTAPQNSIETFWD